MSKLKLAVIFVLFLAASVFAESKPSVWAEQIRNWRLQEAFTCRVYRDSGINQGQIRFQRQFPNCAHIYLTSQWFNSFFGPSTQQSATRDQLCFEIGYKLGFLGAYDELWNSCHEELSETIQAANEENLLQCKALAGVISQDRQAEIASLESNSDLEPDLVKEVATILVLVNRGNYQDAWQNIVRIHANFQKSLVPCGALIGAELKK